MVLDTEPDTEVLLATLASLVDHLDYKYSQDELLCSLISHGGNVDLAAAALHSKRRIPSGSTAHASKPMSRGMKRKRTAGGLDGWLKGRPSDSKQLSPSPSPPRTRRREPSPIKAPSSTQTSSPAKPTVNLMTILRDPSSSTSNSSCPARIPPLTLGTPNLVALHTPCTLHHRVLPPELASDLFHIMVDEAQKWRRNEWWFFDRMVTSPHRTAMYARTDTDAPVGDAWDDAAGVWYNGRRTEPPFVFPAEMEAACKIIEEVVNTEIRKRQRKPLEWAGSNHDPNSKSEADGDGKAWRANVAGANCYEGSQENVGFHTDGLSYLGPYPTIASLSLGTSRTFRLRDVVPVSEESSRNARTLNIPVVHNSLVIMHAGCQEAFKHAVPPQRALDVYTPPSPHPGAPPGTPPKPSRSRINITFRFFRPDFKPSTVPICKCGTPTVLRPDARRRGYAPEVQGKQTGPKGGDLAKDTGKKASHPKDGGDQEAPYRYWWTCNGGATNEGKGCGFWRVMDIKAEGRGPCVMDITRDAPVLADTTEQ